MAVTVSRLPGVAWLRRHPDIAALVLYVCAALLIEQEAVTHLGNGCDCNGSDPEQFMWSMVWWPHAILHRMNPFRTHALWADSEAFNVAANTTIPLPALVFSPLTAIAGPLVSYNVANLVAPVLNGYVAYRLCRHITRAPAASILAGYLFGFSVYWWSELEGHTHLVFTFAAPLAAWLTLLRLSDAMSVRRYAVLLALDLIAQMLCGTEMAFTLTLLAGISWIAAYAFADADLRRRLIRLLPAIVLAYAAMLIICSPYIYWVAKGPSVAIGRGLLYPADALSFLVPPSTIWFGGHTFFDVTGAFLGNTAENGTYIGIPLFTIAVAYGFANWSRRSARFLVTVFAVAILWSLGGILYINGHNTVDLPWRLVEHLTAFNQVETVRIGDYIALLTAIITAIWLAADGRFRPGRWAWALLGVLLVIPSVNARSPLDGGHIYATDLNVPSFFTGSIYKRYLTPGENVAPIPFAMNGQSLLWQADAHIYFNLASGDFYEPNDYRLDPLGAQLLANTPSAAATPLVGPFVAQHDVGAFLVQPGPTDAGWESVLQAAGLTGQSVGGMLVYDTPASWRHGPPQPSALPAGCTPLGSACP